MRYGSRILLIGALVLTCSPLSAKDQAPKELGAVQWNRGYSETAKLAKEQNKPLLVLFQEVPG